MKKLTHLGCLLALVFAGASAFADPWFNDVVKATSENGWYVPGEGKWTWHDTYGTLNDWAVGAAYTAGVSKAVSKFDSKITTKVKFTAMDVEDLSTYDISSAKAGVTVVEVAGDNATPYAFKVIKNGEWVDAGVSVESLDEPITVTVKFDKADTASLVSYVIGGTTVIGGTADGTITSVEYKGQCDLYTNLTGLAWGNVSGEPSKVEITSYPQDYNGPTTIKYDHGDLKAHFAGTTLDADNDADVIAYMTTKQGNGQFGWVNYALGQKDNEAVGIQSNDVVNASKLSFDFGFVGDKDNYAVTYSVDGETAAGSAEVAIASGVHTVAVRVTDKATGTAYEVTNQVVGVMKAESPASTGKTTGKVYEIVAVPWEAFGHTLVTVENLLVTSLLTNGDTLYVWNEEGYYDTYTLTDGKWVAQSHTSFSSQTGAVTKEGTSATENTLAQGTAVWIEHDVSSKIVFTGMLKDDSPASTVKTTVWGGDKATWTLIANPSIKPFDFSEIGDVGDRIVIEDAADPREYELTSDNGWGYLEKYESGSVVVRNQTKPVYSTRWKSAEPIPAGIGFWYVRKAGGGSFEITFADNNKVETK